MSLSLYGFDYSPFVAATRQALIALAVPHEMREVSSWDRSEILLLTNGAYYQVPVLEDDGELVFESSDDSQDVARHIDERYGKGRLFPGEWDGLISIVLHYLENEVEGISFRLCDLKLVAEMRDPVARGLFVRHKERKFGRGCVEQWAAEEDALLAQTSALLKPLDRRLAKAPFLFGKAPCYPDFLLFGILRNLSYRDYHTIPEELAALQAFDERMKSFTF